MKRVRIGLLLALATALFLGCARPEAEEPVDQVTVQLKWVHQAQFAGFYLAQERGYYAEENLAVSFVEGGPGIQPEEQVAAGQADFGVGAPEVILLQRGQGQPVVAIAAIYRRNPTVFAALVESGIERPADLLGRSVSVAGVAEFEMQLKAMFNRLGLDVSQVATVPHSYDLGPFQRGEVDSIAIYSTGGVMRLRQAGVNVNLIWPGDYGVRFYADTLFTTERMISENPDVVARFLRATLRGWREAIEDTQVAGEITLRYAKEADLELQTLMMEASAPLVHTGQDQIGWMRPEVWQGMHQILLEQGILEEPVDVGQAYTMEFLEEVYGGER